MDNMVSSFTSTKPDKNTTTLAFITTSNIEIDGSMDAKKIHAYNHHHSFSIVHINTKHSQQIIKLKREN